MAPIDIASLAAFRIGLGLLLFVSTVRFVAKGWLWSLLISPRFHFTYAPFYFVRALPLPIMLALFAVLALSAIAVACGYLYRLSVAIFFVGFTYVELIEKATYLNHYYFVSLITAMLALLPAADKWSMDVRTRRRRPVEVMPTWVLWALRFQVGIVYFYAGVAKLNVDWLFRAQPLRIWLAARADLPFVGPLLETPFGAYAASWAGAVFDLSVPWLLLCSCTRRFAFAGVVFFHLLTGILFPIGIFPWLMVLSATLFFEPSWPRRLFERGAHARGLDGNYELVARIPRWVPALLAAHCAIQVVLPLRQQFMRAPSSWTMDGFNFAWNVMVAEKRGEVTFEATDRHTGETFVLDTRQYLAPFQEQAMAQDPEMIRAFAAFIARELRVRQGREVAVRAFAFASLNGRKSAILIDPRADLAHEE